MLRVRVDQSVALLRCYESPGCSDSGLQLFCILVLEHFMLPAADQLYGDADFISQQDLAPAHSAKATSTWFKDHGIPVLNWPANSPDLNPIENLWGIVKRKMQYARPKNAEELKATIRATWALITHEQCHRLIDSDTPHCCSNSGKRSPN
uniref:Tc1-like transposase DDE domain-containing protein n=1 Tax=Cyprinus carpio carpio TaxID=630221 RepID=A0A9J7Z6L1_CYPCA